MEIYVSVSGNDQWDGSKEYPVKTIEKAKSIVRTRNKTAKENITIKIKQGKYYLKSPLVFDVSDGGNDKVKVKYEGIGQVIISGAVSLTPCWKMYNNGIYKTEVPENADFDSLYINGQLRHLARYPSFDKNGRYFNGYAKDSFDRKRIQKYKDPKGGFMHVMHEGLWGDFHYEITGKSDSGELEYKGGWQNNRPSEMHGEIRFIENIFEELDSPGEWFLSRDEGLLYYMPVCENELENALVEGASLKNLITIKGTSKEPVRNIEFKNLIFTQTKRTFMEQMEPVLRSDWCIYRGGALYLEGTEDIKISDCEIKNLGGNGITISKYNINTAIKSCLFENIGATSVLLAGDSAAVRGALFGYDQTYSDEKAVDWNPGSKNENFPRKCMVEDCLMVRNGRIEKQSAAICLSVCSNIKIKNNTIYEVPRAGINICDGTWGGHEITENIVFDTVLETSDHGAFNSWGRDRYWDYRYDVMEKRLEQNPDLPLLDAVEPTIIRHNIFQCSNGWDIDLDDGSSNYEIIGNLCLKGGIKNREGIKRIVKYNILLNNTFHPHVWFKNSRDEFAGNIIFRPYADIGLHQWGERFDNNILYCTAGNGEANELQNKSHMDQNSKKLNVKFSDVFSYDFYFENYEITGLNDPNMLDFRSCGVISSKLKQISKSPSKEYLKIQKLEKQDDSVRDFDGMLVKRLSGLGEISATGMYQETGIYVKEISRNSKWYRRGIRSNDVILYIDENEVMNVEHLAELINSDYKEIMIWREQGKRIL